MVAAGRIHTLTCTQIPSFFIFLMGLFMWLNFSWINSMYIYWPVVLIGLTVIIIFLPARVLYHRSRKWFAFSNVGDLRATNLLISLTGAVASSTGWDIPR